MKKSMMFCFILVFMSSACAPSQVDEAPSDVDSSANDTTEGNGSDDADVVLDFWHIDPGEKGEVYERAVERFKENNPNVDVNVLRIPNDDYKQRMVVAMSGGDPPDVFHSWGGSWLNEFVDAGSVKSLEESDIEFDQYLDVALDNATFDDEIYGVPLGVSLTMFFYNTGIFDELGLDVPSSYDEFLNIAEILVENDYFPLALANQTGWTGAYYQEYFVNRLGGESVYEEALQREGRGFDDEDYISASEEIQSLVDMGAFNSGFNGIPYDAGQGRQLMYSEQAAMMLITTSFLNNVRDEAPQFEDDLGVFTFPIMEEGEGDPTNLLGSGAPVWSVYEETEHADLAVELVKELGSEETSYDYMETTASMSSYEGLESEDPFVQQFIDLLEDANHLAMPYDQTMPPSLAQVHLDTTQEILGMSITPEEAAEMVEEAAQQSLDD